MDTEADNRPQGAGAQDPDRTGNSEDGQRWLDLAWAEASRINALYVDQIRLAGEATARADAAERALRTAELRISELENARHDPATMLSGNLVLKGDYAPRIIGSYGRPDPFDRISRQRAEFFNFDQPGNAASRFDVAILLMFPGWDKELRSNRWHVARLLAKRMRVILVQPQLALDAVGPVLRRDKFLDNAWVLEVRAHQHRSEDDWREAQGYVSDIRWAIRLMGGICPLIWLFSPYFGRTFATLAEGFRLIHATEDWPVFPGLSAFAKASYEDAIEAADTIVGVSQAVTDRVSAVRPDVRALTLTNGCEFSAYVSAEPHTGISGLRDRENKRIAVFAGNIDFRIDMELLHQLSETQPETQIVMIGPVHSLSADDVVRWAKLLRRPNVFWLGQFPADSLPSVYHASDVGIVPYKPLPLIVDANFSLKVLEMAGSGLPVVSTPMRAIENLSPAIHVTSTRDEFVERVGSSDRSRLTEDQSRSLLETARAHDYEPRFSALFEQIDSYFLSNAFNASRLKFYSSRVSKLVANTSRRIAESREPVDSQALSASKDWRHNQRLELVRAARQVSRYLGYRNSQARAAQFACAEYIEPTSPERAFRRYRHCLDWDRQNSDFKSIWLPSCVRRFLKTGRETGELTAADWQLALNLFKTLQDVSSRRWLLDLIVVELVTTAGQDDQKRQDVIDCVEQPASVVQRLSSEDGSALNDFFQIPEADHQI